MARIVDVRGRETRNAFLRAFSKRRSTFWQMTRDIFLLKYRPTAWTTCALLITAAYIIFPYDFIADYDSIAGFLDDLLVLAICSRILFGETHHYIRYKAMSRRH